MKLRLIFVWVLVVVPLAWGVAKSVQKSRTLFESRGVPAVRPATP